MNDTKLRKKGLAPFATSSPNFSPLNSHGNVSPDFMDVIHYCLCFMGIMTGNFMLFDRWILIEYDGMYLFTGPYYKYKVFHDMINSTQLHNIPREKMALERLRMLPCYVMIFLTMSTVFDFSVSVATVSVAWSEYTDGVRFVLMTYLWESCRWRETKTSGVQRRIVETWTCRKLS